MGHTPARKNYVGFGYFLARKVWRPRPKSERGARPARKNKVGFGWYPAPKVWQPGQKSGIFFWDVGSTQLAANARCCFHFILFLSCCLRRRKGKPQHRVLPCPKKGRPPPRFSRFLSFGDVCSVALKSRLTPAAASILFLSCCL